MVDSHNKHVSTFSSMTVLKHPLLHTTMHPAVFWVIRVVIHQGCVGTWCLERARGSLWLCLDQHVQAVCTNSESSLKGSLGASLKK